MTTPSSFPPPPKVRESRFDDWMYRFYRRVDGGGLGSKWTASGSDIYRNSKVSIGGHVEITAASSMYRGDFSNATHANRNGFQTSITNGNTSIPVIPNGTGTTSTIFLANSSSVANSSYAQLAINGTTDTRLVSSKLGTGTVLPLGVFLGSVQTATFKESRELVCNPSFINVRQYGATGDGSRDDTTEIGYALTDAAANGMRRVYFPQGTYRITSALSISGDFTLFGDGPSTSIIKVDHAGDGINYTGVHTATESEKLEVLHLGFRSNSSSADCAIEASWTLSGGGTYPAHQPCFIHDVAIGGATTSATFTYGIKLTDAAHCLVSNVNIFGLEGGTIASGTYGVYFDSGTDQRVENCTFHYIETGLYAVDAEGVHCSGNVFLSCLDGARFDNTGTDGRPGLYVCRNHFNVGRYGIHTTEQVQMFIGDNLIYGDQRTPTAGSTFIGVRIESGSLGTGISLQSIVRDNIVVMVNESVGGYTTANYGYAVYGGSGTVESVFFSGNKSQACDTLIYMDSSTTGIIVNEDNLSISGETWSDNGAYNNTPYGAYTPTGYGITNCTDGDITEYEATWTRTGNIVTVLGDVDVNPTAANAVTTFRLSLPVPSDMGAATQLSGTISPSGVNSPSGAAGAHTATSPDRVEFSFYATFSTATRMSYVYRYRVS